MFCFIIYSTTSVECCYQNVGIATSVALTMFEGDELSLAMGVPFFYGVVEAAVLGVYCIGAWKAGWTKAPKDESFCTVISTSYEVQAQQDTEHQVEIAPTDKAEIQKESVLPDGNVTHHYSCF